MKNQEKVFKIKGIDCASCALNIEMEVSKVPGVRLAQVSFASSELKVLTDSSQFDFGDITSTIESLGYSVEAEESDMTLNLKIEGMDCADESEIIEKKMKSLAGVKNFDINLMTQQIKIF